MTQAVLIPRTRLVGALFGTLKLVQMYGPRHDAAAGALASLAGAVRDAAEGGEASVGVAGPRLLVNDERLRAADCGQLAVGHLVDEWTRRGLQAVRFAEGVTPAALEAFAVAFLDVDVVQPGTAERLVAAAAAGGATGVTIEPREERAPDPVPMEERRESAMRSYLRGLRAFRDILRRGGMGDRVKVRRARRAVQGLVDRILEDEAAVLALAQIRAHDVRLFNHSLNVCLYSLAIGHRLGMSRKQLGELGLAALFHDIGKTWSSGEAKPKDGDAPDSWESLRHHPVRGLRMLLEAPTTHEGILKAAIAAYEHHVHLDRSGFPNVEHEQHLVARIVAIADCYESLTTPRTYREAPYSSTDAFALLFSKAGSLFDPLLLKVFVNAVGTYPAGTVVRLSTGEVAIVTAGPSDPRYVDRPRVRIVQRGGGTLAPEATADLAERLADGSFPRSIEDVMPAHEVFPTVGGYVSAL